MKRTHKIGAAAVMIVCGLLLIGWNFRDPDAAYREPQEPKVETVVTLETVPPAIRATVERLLKSGGKLEDIQEERKGDEVKYEVDIISANTKTEYEIAPDGTVTGQKSKKLKS